MAEHDHVPTIEDGCAELGPLTFLDRLEGLPDPPGLPEEGEVHDLIHLSTSQCVFPAPFYGGTTVSN